MQIYLNNKFSIRRTSTRYALLTFLGYLLSEACCSASLILCKPASNELNGVISPSSKNCKISSPAWLIISRETKRLKLRLYRAIKKLQESIT